MRAFGDINWAVELDRVPTPVGQQCLHCEEPIEAGESGVTMPYDNGTEVKEEPMHRECVLRTIFGSVGHQERRCQCFGGDYDDPPGMTRRQAAKAAAAMVKNELVPRLD